MGLTGMIMRKDPQISAPDEIKEELDDVTLTGETMEEFVQGALDQILVTGRVGIQIDYPPNSRPTKIRDRTGSLRAPIRSSTGD